MKLKDFGIKFKDFGPCPPGTNPSLWAKLVALQHAEQRSKTCRYRVLRLFRQKLQGLFYRLAESLYEPGT